MYAKIKDSLRIEDVSLEDEEFEDANGNVLTKKMYNDLVRQGLLWVFETSTVILEFDFFVNKHEWMEKS